MYSHDLTQLQPSWTFQAICSSTKIDLYATPRTALKLCSATRSCWPLQHLQWITNLRCYGDEEWISWLQNPRRIKCSKPSNSLKLDVLFMHTCMLCGQSSKDVSYIYLISILDWSTIVKLKISSMDWVHLNF